MIHATGPGDRPSTLPFGPATRDASVRLWVIAEIGVNHDGDPARAVELVHAAADAGADAVKFQLFDPDLLLSRDAVLAGYQKRSETDVHAMLRRLAMSPADLAKARAAARERGLAFVLTPFSLELAGAVARLDVDAIKIASPDVVNLPLLERMAGLDKPMLVSTGAAELSEVDEAASLLHAHRPGGALLHCVSSYPTPAAQAGLGAIRALSDRFSLPVGYSDHTGAEWTGALAVAAGACLLETHLTWNRDAPGPDHQASFNPEGFAAYVSRAREAAASLGPIGKTVAPVEREVRRICRQSVCLGADCPAGHVLTRDDLTVKRPGEGVAARDLWRVVGRTLRVPGEANRIIRWDDLEAQAPVGRVERQASDDRRARPA